MFYGWWDWRFLALWLFTAGVDYLVALGFSRTEDTGRRKFLMGLSLTANLGLLGFFKYFDFFLLSFVDAFSFFGHPIDARPLGIVLLPFALGILVGVVYFQVHYAVDAVAGLIIAVFATTMAARLIPAHTARA